MRFKMYFVKSFSSIFFLLVLIDGFTQAAELKKIIATTRELQQEINRALRSMKENCNSSTASVDNYEKVVSDFLKENFTLHESSHFNPIVNQPLKIANQTTESFMTKLKRKLLELVHGTKTVAQPETRIKRCWSTNDSDFDDVEIKMEKKVFNVTVCDVNDFEKKLLRVIDCLKHVEVSDNLPAPAPDEGN